MSEEASSFSSFVGSSLQQLQLDEEVFSGYVTGILESSEKGTSFDEHLESLLEVLQDAVESDVSTSTVKDVCSLIVRRWICKLEADEKEEEERKEQARAALQAKLSSQAPVPETAAARAADNNTKPMTAEEMSRRQAFLAQYNYELEDEDIEGSDEESSQAARIDRVLGVFENTNRRSVAEAKQAERDEMRVRHAAKVQQTKEAREKQLQRERERKEKAKQKVQKRERRR